MKEGLLAALTIILAIAVYSALGYVLMSWFLWFVAEMTR